MDTGSKENSGDDPLNIPSRVSSTLVLLFLAIYCYAYVVGGHDVEKYDPRGRDDATELSSAESCNPNTNTCQSHIGNELKKEWRRTCRGQWTAIRSKSIEVYDPEQNQWRLCVTMNYRRLGSGVVLVKCLKTKLTCDYQKRIPVACSRITYLINAESKTRTYKKPRITYLINAESKTREKGKVYSKTSTVLFFLEVACAANGAATTGYQSYED
ncbi:hypothetical protein DAPPUDRAFT_250267 [Daphnia pulex]|uniref:Uncharacterized protein n=1 Tax=Daphnia pulex TaxID=6669 RepID=E9GY78_DAPPU|nr:hypothetical protein DAPPUDRAFT_250267 [Daphnia pulex]|eukprot:EFX75555.1 hypothetical protein DAPPUDRAFT_250267 [Daphnia pulex]